MRYSARRAATAVEYGLIAGAILLAIIGGVTATGNGLSNLFGSMSNNTELAAEQPYIISGVTGVGGIPYWITTKCVAPTQTQFDAATSNPANFIASTNCAPSGSTVGSFTASSDTSGQSATALYVVPKNGSTGFIYAIEYGGSIFSWAGFYNTNQNCVGNAAYGSAGILSSSGSCQTTGLAPAASEGGVLDGYLAGNYYTYPAGTPSMEEMLSQLSYDWPAGCQNCTVGNGINLPMSIRPAALSY